jgi:hypothetical protein
MLFDACKPPRLGRLFYADSSEIDTRDQFIDRASQSSAQRQFWLESQ